MIRRRHRRELAACIVALALSATVPAEEERDWQYTPHPSNLQAREWVRVFKDAGDRHGLKLFFYYSQLDWHHPDIGGIWFDGWWEQKGTAMENRWRLQETCELFHRLQPQALIISNHHTIPFPDEQESATATAGCCRRLSTRNTSAWSSCCA